MGHAKKSAISVGMVHIPVRLEVAVDAESSGAYTVCTGAEGSKHDPTRVKAHVDCPTCGRSHSSVFGYTERAVERDGKLVVLTAEEIKAAKGEPVKKLDLVFCSREKVHAGTLASDSVQYISPDKGGEEAYTALAEGLALCPELVGVAVFAPSTKNALWVVEVIDGRLVASKRCWPEERRAAPAIARAEVSDVDRDWMVKLIESKVEDFDITKFQDTAKRGVSDLIASRLGDAVPAAAGAPVAPSSGGLLAAIQASLPATPPAKPKAAKKAPAKKAAAKKATTRKKVA